MSLMTSLVDVHVVTSFSDHVAARGYIVILKKECQEGEHRSISPAE